MPKDTAREALDAANQLAAEGKFPEALAKHIWFHDHALEVDQAYYGVRLSYALGYWIELGRKYPPALVALHQIRDSKTSRLSSGETNRALFNDVVAINNRLHQPNATVELFKKIDATHPEFAASLYDLVEKALVATHEYALARRHLRDPAKRFRVTKRNFDEGMEFFETKTGRAAEASREATKAIFIDEVLRILTVLDKTGDRTAARAIQAKALAVVQSPIISNAIKD